MPACFSWTLSKSEETEDSQALTDETHMPYIIFSACGNILSTANPALTQTRLRAFARLSAFPPVTPEVF